MQRTILQVDAFTPTPFRGNPAAVCVLEVPASETWMREVAREMNLSETAFLNRDDGVWHLRWFTPTTEVELCGHATLASAHVLWERGHLDPGSPAIFETRSGKLVARRRGAWIEMDFPARPAAELASAEEAAELADALGATPLAVRRNPYDIIAELSGESEVVGLRPNLAHLSEIARRGVIATSLPGPERAASGVDFVSRFFAPAYGVPEDPVTGSAHCTLGPYWAERLGRSELVGFQVSERGGEVRVRVGGDTVCLLGQAVTVLEARLLV